MFENARGIKEIHVLDCEPDTGDRFFTSQLKTRFTRIKDMVEYYKEIVDTRGVSCTLRYCKTMPNNFQIFDGKRVVFKKK